MTFEFGVFDSFDLGDATPGQVIASRLDFVGQAPVNYFEGTFAFGDLTLAEATANLTAFAETVMPVVRAAFTARTAGAGA
jgi:hypothetical protein